MPILMTTVTAFTYIAGLLVRGAEGGACPGLRREAGFSLLPGCCTQWLGSSKAGGHPAFAHAGVAPTWGAHPLQGAAADFLCCGSCSRTVPQTGDPFAGLGAPWDKVRMFLSLTGPGASAA